MERFFAILRDGVNRFDGRIDKFTGDGVMALFGAPIAYEDHARRACAAALHLRRGTGPLRGRAEAPAWHQLPRAPWGSTRARSWPARSARTSRWSTPRWATPSASRSDMESLAEPGTGLPHGDHTVRWWPETSSSVNRSPARRRVPATRSAGSRWRDEGLRPSPSGPGPRPDRDPLASSAGAASWPLLEAGLTQALQGNGQVIGVVASREWARVACATSSPSRCRAQRGMTVRRATECRMPGRRSFVPVLEILRDQFGIGERDPRPSPGRRSASGSLELDAPSRLRRCPSCWTSWVFLTPSDPRARH